MRDERSAVRFVVGVSMGVVLLAAQAGAQTSAPAASTAPVAPANAPATSTNAAATATPAKAYAFDVVSIRRNVSPPSPRPYPAASADGYRMTNMPIAIVIMTAYVPQVGGSAFYAFDQIKGLPNWLMTERYDIDARIADEDRAEWQKPELQKVMLQAMLQAMLVDRCKLAVHREVNEVGVSSLVVAKGGPKFKETDPTVEHPDGMKLPWGGTMVPGKDGMTFYGATMASFASILSSMANGGRPVQDKTGLTGKYDLVLTFPDQPGSAPNEQQGVTTASDPGGSMIVPMLNDLGLKLESEKAPVETLVIDHMERPSEN